MVKFILESIYRTGLDDRRTNSASCSSGWRKNRLHVTKHFSPIPSHCRKKDKHKLQPRNHLMPSIVQPSTTSLHTQRPISENLQKEARKTLQLWNGAIGVFSPINKTSVQQSNTSQVKYLASEKQWCQNKPPHTPPTDTNAPKNQPPAQLSQPAQTKQAFEETITYRFIRDQILHDLRPEPHLTRSSTAETEKLINDSCS